jgi:hypothetical protein
MRSWLFWDVTQCILIVTDVSGQAVGPIFKGQAILEDGNDTFYRNFGNYESTLRNIPEERSSQNFISLTMKI